MFDKLNDRERLFIVFGVAIFLLLGLIFLGKKIGDMRARISEDVAAAREETAKIIRLRDAINNLPSPQSLPDMNQFISQTSQLMEKHSLQAADIRNRTESTARKEEMLIVELTFNGVGLREIIKFLHDVEFGGKVNARVGNLVFRKPLPQREIYDVKISLEIIKPKAATPRPSTGGGGTP